MTCFGQAALPSDSSRVKARFDRLGLSRDGPGGDPVGRGETSSDIEMGAQRDSQIT